MQFELDGRTAGHISKNDTTSVKPKQKGIPVPYMTNKEKKNGTTQESVIPQLALEVQQHTQYQQQ
jgi:hypothetical protein